MGVLARQWLSPSEVDYCTICAKIEGLAGAEALIAWTPDVGVRAGDTVVCEYDCKAGRRTAFLKAERAGHHLILRTRCSIPDFIYNPGSCYASNGLMVTEIKGIVRGAYLCF